MIPITELLNKIRWDNNLKEQDFTIGYKHNDKIIKIPYNEVEMTDKFSFTCIQHNKRTDIPFHRIRIVWQNDKIFWQRPVEN